MTASREQMITPGLIFRFGRPHTLIATSFQTLGIFTVMIAGERLIPERFGTLLLAWVGSLAANLYVVGLNQLYDIEIDRINKPHLPLPAKEISQKAGRTIVLAAAFIAILTGIVAGIYLFATLFLVMLIGTLYSVPPLRLKMRAVWAALSISVARGLVANAGLFLFFAKEIVPGDPVPGFALGLGLTFIFLFVIVIAIYKDIPDWDGDRKYRILTFAVKLGCECVFRWGRWLLIGMYLIPIIGGLLLSGLGGSVLAIVHMGALALFWKISRATNPNEPSSMHRLYRLLWILFYSEYVFFGLYRLIT